MNPVSIGRFQSAQQALMHPIMAIPIVAIGPSLAKIVVSLAQIIHGLAMALFYAIKEINSDEPHFAKQYLGSVKEGIGHLGIGIGNLATVGFLGLGITIYGVCNMEIQGPEDRPDAPPPVVAT
jgi:hypothetical protein